MKPFAWMFVLCLSAVPAFAQDDEDGKTLNVDGQFALGNLAVRELVNSNGPIQQLKNFFDGALLPLSKDQEHKLDRIVEAHQQELQNLQSERNEAEAGDAVRKLNQEYLKLMNAALTAGQQAAWRHYRVEQIRLRGGFPALKQVLDDAKAPLEPEQEKSVQKIFENFAQRHTRLAATTPNQDVAEVDRLVVAEFNRVVALLTPEQRAAVRASRPAPRSIARR